MSQAIVKASTAPVYLYLFNHTLKYTDLHTPSYGCYHSSELFLVFDVLHMLLTPDEQTLAAAFVK